MFFCRKSQINIANYIANLLDTSYNLNMENVVLSANVKKYLVNALKGLGIREPKLNKQGRYPELTEAAIANLLDDSNTTFFGIYVRIKCAVLHQLQNDAMASRHAEGPNCVKDETAVDRQTVKKLLQDFTKQQNSSDAIILDPETSDKLLRRLTASDVGIDGKILAGNVSGNIDSVIEETMKAIMVGLSDKKLSVEEKRAVSLFLNEIRYAGFKDWLMNKTNQYSEQKFNLLVQGNVNESKYGSLYTKYNVEKVRAEVLNRTVDCLTELAIEQNKEKLRKTKPKRNESDIEESAKNMVNRDYIKTSAEDLLSRVLKDNKKDTLNILSVDSGLKNRAEEFQKKRIAVGLDDIKDLTLLDVLVAVGNDKTQLKAFIEARAVEQECNLERNPKFFEVKKENKIGTILGEQGLKHLKSQGVTVNVDHDIATIKSGKKGPWRGYKALFDRCYNYYQSEIYGPIPSIGLIQGIMSEKGTYKDSEKQNTVKKMEEPWKTDYGEMPADYKDENGVLNLAGEFYNKTKARILLDKSRISHWKYLDAKTRPAGVSGVSAKNDERLAYLQNRITVAEDILANKMPKKGTADFDKEETYAKFEAQIIDKEHNQDDLIQDLVDDEVDGRPFNPNAAWCAVYRNLNEVVDDKTPAGREATREMANDIFGLQGQYAKDKVNNDDLEALAKDFVYGNDVGRQMYDLVDNNKIEAAVAMTKTNNMAVNALQKKHWNDAEYQQYRREEHRQKINDAVGREL